MPLGTVVTYLSGRPPAYGRLTGVQVDAHIVGSGARQGFFVWRAPDLKTALHPQLPIAADDPGPHADPIAQHGGSQVVNFGSQRRHAATDPHALIETDAQLRGM